MAGLEGLASLIYHEKQQPGSMLCAQHALNSLLQGNYFTAPDLSAIAHSLDELEGAYNEDRRSQESTNMDDTGFFSVQVLENALQVWGLSLVRWRSEAMRPYHDQPHKQLAFILNHQQHWYTIRRFGPASPRLDEDPGIGHWFNLNSSLPAPEWVGKLYLGMVLHQAEDEGYSVFAVTQIDPSAPLALPRTEADDVAATLPEPTSANLTRHAFPSRTASSASTSTPQADVVEGFEDEDLELQRALQASLLGGTADELMMPPPSSVPSTATGTRTPTQGSSDLASRLRETGPSGMNEDVIAASMARNRATFEMMRRQQEAALRDSYDEEIARYEAIASTSRQPTRGANTLEEEQEMIRRAIEQSRRTGDDDDGDDDMHDPDYVPPEIAGTSAEPIHPALDTTRRGPESYRNYDDEDEELQAALRASLETLPEGFRVPSPPPRAAVPAPQPPAMSVPTTAEPARPGISRSASKESDVESEISSDFDSTTPAESEAAAAVAVDHDEMRRKRLARFGG
ncbi:Josephin-domain-containing protein [Punctularia strigosozonata HHB-11173 SS5]|uniref:Josephin-domain-containing protein n=1 Tax=Punctularia strigosozonata (strain HHB-11173) TaxID=741275 RepID=UPI0004416E36|nr:Josephin-domain-containing protein [Punctularia strigosozonata HHB-11173 SS5]EIN11689.1 Josephin-domain-containing protein [Punctularia strigosozonata HHB-11173 SS5]